MWTEIFCDIKVYIVCAHVLFFFTIPLFHVSLSHVCICFNAVNKIAFYNKLCVGNNGFIAI